MLTKRKPIKSEERFYGFVQMAEKTEVKKLNIIFHFLTLTIIVLTVVMPKAFASDTLKVAGLKIYVRNIPEAKKFYSTILGFPVIKETKAEIVLKSGGKYSLTLVLYKGKTKPNEGAWNNISFAIQTANLDSAFHYLKSRDVVFLKQEKRKEGVGYSYHMYDPFNNSMSLMEITVGRKELFSGPRMYNFGLYVSDIETSRKLFCDQLGFVTRSTKYLPSDMPLGHFDSSFAFMLHANREEFQPVNTESNDTRQQSFVIVFTTVDLASTRKRLESCDIKHKMIDGGIVFFDSNEIEYEIMKAND